MDALTAALELDLRKVRVLVTGEVEDRFEGDRPPPLRVVGFEVLGEPLALLAEGGGGGTRYVERL